MIHRSSSCRSTICATSRRPSGRSSIGSNRISDKLYIHIDMDVLDPREVMAHGNKVPNGPSSEQLERLFEQIFARYPKASAIGFATIPPTDEGGLSIAALNRMIAGAVRGVKARNDLTVDSCQLTHTRARRSAVSTTSPVAATATAHRRRRPVEDGSIEVRPRRPPAACTGDLTRRPTPRVGASSLRRRRPSRHTAENQVLDGLAPAGSILVAAAEPLTARNDAELLEGFVSTALPADQFHHEQHVRVAWLFVREHGMPAALGEFSSAIKRFADGQGRARASTTRPSRGRSS